MPRADRQAVTEAVQYHAGYAVNFIDGRYGAAEAEARGAKRGIWRGSFERPQEWRRRKG